MNEIEDNTAILEMEDHIRTDVAESLFSDAEVRLKRIK